MPPLPWELQEEFTSTYGLSSYDAQILTEEKTTALFFIDLAKQTKNYKAAANLTINKIKPWTDEEKKSIANFPVSSNSLAGLIQLIDDGKVSNSIAYQKLLPALIASPSTAPLALAESLNILQSTDSNFLEELADEVIANNPDKVKAYQKGKKGLIGFFMGELMKKSKGKAEPKSANALLRKKLEEN